MVREETAKDQLESIGYWFVGAITAIPDWRHEHETMKEMLHALVDDYLENGEDCSNKLTAKSLDQVVDDIQRDCESE